MSNGEILKVWADILQSCVTTIGLVIAGIWSYYVFIRGRTFDPNVEIKLELKQTVTFNTHNYAIVSVKVKNIGKTRVNKLSCILTAYPISGDLDRVPTITETDTAKVERQDILNGHAYLEPNEEGCDDVLLKVYELTPFRVNVRFRSDFISLRDHLRGLGTKGWNSSAIFDPRMIKQRAD